MFGELNPQGGGDSIPLLGRKLMVGRRPSCDIVLPFSNVSSHHCELELRKGYWYVRDLNSANGVKVNGEKIMTKCLYPGDELAVGKHKFRIEYSTAGEGPIPDEPENELEMSLLEKAGLQRDRDEEFATEGGRTKDKSKRTPRLSAEDEFILEWFPDF